MSWVYNNGTRNRPPTEHCDNTRKLLRVDRRLLWIVSIPCLYGSSLRGAPWLTDERKVDKNEDFHSAETLQGCAPEPFEKREGPAENSNKAAFDLELYNSRSRILPEKLVTVVSK